MPSVDAILANSTAIANQWQSIAIGWHAALAALVLALIAGWHPTARRLGALLIAPPLSVSALAFLSGNPFNGAMFALLSLGLAATVRDLPRNPIHFAPLTIGPGALMIVFGWMYPHFLQTGGWMRYAYAAPFGVLPCPTLSVLVGVALLAGLHRGPRWTGLLIAAGLLYGSVGVFRLGVDLDYVLIAGTIVLAAFAVHDSAAMAALHRQTRSA